MRRAFVLLAATILLSSPLSAFAHKTRHHAPAAPPEVTLLKRLQTDYPTLDVTSVKPSPVAGLFEMTYSHKIAYVDASGRYFITGDLLDLKARKNLSADAQTSARRIDPAKLPMADSFKLTAGNGSRVIYVFSDPDCPYCQALDTRLATLDNYTAYIFLFPLGEIHPDAVRKATAIWCAPDKAAAWIATMRDHKAIDTATCDTPIVRNRALGESFGIDGTPAIYLADGMPFENSSDALDAAMTAAAVPAVKTP